MAHAVCDYPLQGDFLAKAKNHKQPIPGVPWQVALAAHCLIHAGGVALVLMLVGHAPNYTLAAAVTLELWGHFLTDYRKCDGRVGFIEDQSLHVAYKLLYALALL